MKDIWPFKWRIKDKKISSIKEHVTIILYFLALSAFDIHRKKKHFHKIYAKKLDLHLKKLKWEGWCCDSFERILMLMFWICPAKGQLISKGHFCVLNSSKKQTENFCPSRLG